MYKLIGIDEAGKGPVIGSMFIGFAIVNLENGVNDINSFHNYLKEMGVKDSKKLTEKSRLKVYEKLANELDIKYVQLTPFMIDSNNKKGDTLNNLEINAIVSILNEQKPNLVIIDALTSNPEKFKESILKKLNFECKIIAENKADDKYEIVGAASIIAKQLRENEIQDIKKKIGIDFGSGYPSDSRTHDFLLKNYENKEFDFIFRKSWQTYKDVSKKNKTILDY